MAQKWLDSDDVHLIGPPTRYHLVVGAGAAVASIASYAFANTIVTSFILSVTDHILICIILSFLLVLLAMGVLDLFYRGWIASDRHNDWLRLMAMATGFFVGLAVFVMLLLALALVTSPFFAPGIGNEVTFFLLLFFVVMQILLAASRISLGVVLNAEAILTKKL
jgi:hypothetical protein